MMGKGKLVLFALGAALVLCLPAAATGEGQGAAPYGAIDGKRMWQDVVEQARIAERYRDQGHPQFWGRISGTSADTEDAHWLLAKFRETGLSDTRIQTVQYLDPQWAPKSWTAALEGGGKTVVLTSAEPSYGSPDTKGETLDLPVVYVGLGSEADFAGREVKGKAVLLVKEGLSRQIGPQDVLKRAEAHGAAAILSTDLRGGNATEQAYRAYTHVPSFLLGTSDADAIRAMIASAPANAPPHVTIRLEAAWAAHQNSYLVWGTLPGQTDETIYVIAHRDGWFDGAGDNASGVASMLGLADYFAKVPKSQRRRTMVFIGTDGHHNIKPGEFGTEWLVANRARLFARTALMINDEHPAEVLSHGGAAGWTTAEVPLQWYAGGPKRPRLTEIAADAFREFGVPMWSEPSEKPPAGDMERFLWFLPGLVAQSNDFIAMHTTGDTPANVSEAGLESITRAYARIVDEVNTIPLRDLQRPASPDPAAPDTPAGYVNLAKCQAWVEDSSKSCGQ